MVAGDCIPPAAKEAACLLIDAGSSPAKEASHDAVSVRGATSTGVGTGEGATARGGWLAS